MANAIFDFDGTIADTFPLIVDVAYELSGNKPLPAAEIVKLREIPLLTAVRRLGIPRWKMPLVIFLGRHRMTGRMSAVQPYEGILQMLEELHRAGHSCFILTSNYKKNVQIFLRQHKLEEIFKDVVTVPYATSWTKTVALRSLIRRWHMPSDETYHIGNEALDMQAAHKVGIRGIATTWGGFDRAELKSTKPFKVIAKPAELSGLLQ